MNYKIGILAPITVKPLTKFLSLTPGNQMSKGSGGTPIVNLVYGLLEYGHDVSVYSFGFDISQGDSRVYCGSNLRIYLGYYRPKHRMRDLFKVERSQLIEMIQQDRPALLHAHWTYEFALAGLAAKVPTLVTVHDCARNILRRQPDLYRLGRYFINRHVLKRAKYISAVSPYLQTYARKFTKCEVHLIPNVIMPGLISLGNILPKGKNLSKQFRIASFLIWGKLRNAKTAIRAFQQFRSKNRNAEYHFYGSGFENLGPAHTWALQEGLADNLIFHGNIDYDKVTTEMRNADIVIHPSLEESFSMVVAEAMACGVPVIGGVSSGGVPWVLDNGKAGILVDVRSPNDIASALHRLFENQHLREELSYMGQARARSLFTPEAVLPRYEEVYDHLLSG